MAKKIKAPTYAERARRIQKKYPRASWDAWERNDMLKDLRELKIEQEASRPLMEIADKANEMDAGVFSPSQTGQSFGPTNPQEGDPRFQKWAENVPGMGGYNVDPSQMNIQGIPQGAVDPRKMSMQQYRADTQFAVGGPYGQNDPWNYGQNPQVNDNLGMMSMLNSFDTPEAIGKYNKDQDMAARKANHARVIFNNSNPFGSYLNQTASNQLFQPKEGNWSNMPRKGIQGYNDAMDALPNDSYDQMLQISNNRKGLTDKWMNNVMDSNPGYSVNSPMMKSQLEELISPFNRASSQLRGPAGRDFQSRQPQPVPEELIAPPAGMNMSGSEPYVNPWNAPKDNLSGFAAQARYDAGQAPYVPDPSLGIQPEMMAGDFGAISDGVGDVPQEALSKFTTSSVSPLPQVIAAGSNMLGNIAGMINSRAGARHPINLGRMSAEQVNYGQERNTNEIAYRNAQLAGIRNARNMSSPANQYANMMGAQSQLLSSYGSAQGQSYMKEQNTNAQLRQQANAFNAEQRSKEAQLRYSQELQGAGDRAKYIEGMSEVLPRAIKDYGQTVKDNDMANIQGRRVGIYQQNIDLMSPREKWMWRMGMNPKSIMSREHPDVKGSINQRGV